MMKPIVNVVLFQSINASIWHPFHKTKRDYKELNSQGIFLAMNSLVRTYPELVKLQSAQELFGLPTLGEDEDCQFEQDPNNSDDGVGCKTWILTIEDSIVHPDGSTSHERLPEIFLNGAFHGNERVGPTILIESAVTLLDAAYCESLPHGTEPENESKESETWKKWEKELIKAKNCRVRLKYLGIDDIHRKWLARLVATRRIVMVPTLNSLGFYRKTKTEDGINPSSDFPFDTKDETECMRTVAARTMNELFISHLFQIAISFHAGNVAITHSWGSQEFLSGSAPDDTALETVSQGFSYIAGTLKWNNEPYPVGSLNDQHGPHRGRFEDWAYAGSWIGNQNVGKCNPLTYGGYTYSSYSDSMLRAATIKIHTSAEKNPPNEHYGDSEHIFNREEVKHNGYASRNIRLLLMAIDIVEPYVSIKKLNDVELQDDFVPLSPRSARSCIKTKAVTIPKDTEFVTVHWEVGGGFQVDKTSIMYAKWDDLPDEFDGISQPSKELLQKIYDDIDGDEGTFIKESPGGRGKSKWHSSYLHDLLQGPNYGASFDSYDFEEGDKIAVFAVAQLDKNWLKQPSDVKPSFTPQTHLANARTNPDWYYENAGHVVQGRILWFSIPVTLIIGSHKKHLQDVSVRISHVKNKTVEEVLDVSFFFIFCVIGWFSFAAIHVYLEKRRANKEDPTPKRAAGRSYTKVFGGATETEYKDDDQNGLVIELS